MLAHFDITIQHIAGSNLKFTDFLSRNPVENAATEDVYDEQYVIFILSEQAELNSKYGSLFVDQSHNASKRNKMNKTKSDHQSKHNRTFENNRDVNRNRDQAKFTSNNSREKLKPESKIPKVKSETQRYIKIQFQIQIYYYHLRTKWTENTSTGAQQLRLWKSSDGEERAQKLSDLWKGGWKS